MSGNIPSKVTPIDAIDDSDCVDTTEDSVEDGGIGCEDILLTPIVVVAGNSAVEGLSSSIGINN